VNFLELARKRKSVRKYLPKAVPREVLLRCLEAARISPSACNSQPWRFIVVDDIGQKNRLSEAAFSGIYSMNAFAGTAPVLIVVVSERSSFAAALGSCFRGTRYSLIDIGIAGEHFVLQAAEEGLGTCWLGWFDEKKVKRVLGLPGSTKIDIILSAGYPVESDGVEHKRKPLEQVAQFLIEAPVTKDGGASSGEGES